MSDDVFAEIEAVEAEIAELKARRSGRDVAGLRALVAEAEAQVGELERTAGSMSEGLDELTAKLLGYNLMMILVGLVDAAFIALTWHQRK